MIIKFISLIIAIISLVILVDGARYFYNAYQNKLLNKDLFPLLFLGFTMLLISLFFSISVII